MVKPRSVPRAVCTAAQVRTLDYSSRVSIAATSLGRRRRDLPRLSPTRRLDLTKFQPMLVELAIFGAVKLLQNLALVFVAICAAFVTLGVVKRHSATDRLPFMRAAGRDLSRALLMSRHLFVAAGIIVAAACGFVAGRWDGWVVTVVTGLALWGVVGSLAGLRSSQPIIAQPSDSSTA